MKLLSLLACTVLLAGLTVQRGLAQPLTTNTIGGFEGEYPAYWNEGSEPGGRHAQLGDRSVPLSRPQPQERENLRKSSLLRRTKTSASSEATHSGEGHEIKRRERISGTAVRQSCNRNQSFHRRWEDNIR